MLDISNDIMLQQVIIHIQPLQLMLSLANHGIKILAVVKLQVLVQFSYRFVDSI